MQTKFSLLFYLKKPKKYTGGPIPIYLRITISGKPAEISTGRECDPGKWNTAAGRCIGTKEETRLLNIYLDTMQGNVYEAHRQLTTTDETITAETLKNKFIGKADKPRTIIPIFKDHNKKIEALLGQGYTPGTLKRYKTALAHTEEFIKWKYNASDIDLNKIDYAFITEFEFYLRSVKKCDHNTAVKYVKSNFGKIIRDCVAYKWIKENPYINYKSTFKEVKRAFLDQNEIKAIADKKIISERLSLVRDIFLFSCYTGLAYIDVAQLTRKNISLGIDGCNWIFTHRQKTDTASNIPLLPMAQEILDKYKNHPQCINENRLLPILSNQRMNSYLKEIADICQISKELTFHIARHTFATSVTLANGVPIESVGKMLGHKNLRTTQHYAKILDKKVSEDMNLLKQKLQQAVKKTAKAKTAS